jgi:4-hydroxyphenylacetate 3-monooxygenase
VLTFTDERNQRIELEPEIFVIAGYTGRDRAMVQKHIDELAHEGIAPPPEVPMWYEMPVSILSHAAEIEVPTAQTCGEVEPALIGIGDDLYLGIGSDHTARDVEREDIAKSKRVCPKPLGRTIVRIGTPDAAFDAIRLESAIDGEPYQAGSFAQITPLGTLLAEFRRRKSPQSFVLFCGTVPLLTHGFRFGRTFAARIRGGPLTAALTLEYAVTGVRPH